MGGLFKYSAVVCGRHGVLGEHNGLYARYQSRYLFGLGDTAGVLDLYGCRLVEEIAGISGSEGPA